MSKSKVNNNEEIKLIKKIFGVNILEVRLIRSGLKF